MGQIITPKEINKSKNTIYKNKYWFVGKQKTIYNALKYIAKSNDFYLDFKRNLSTYEVIKMGYNEEVLFLSRSNVLKWLIKNKYYKFLKIVNYRGGTDRGILKIKLFLHFRKIKEVKK
jgi:hypothetical protein